jgi:hypothetical protein
MSFLTCVNSGLWLVQVQEKDIQGYLSSLCVISAPFAKVMPFFFHFQFWLPLEVWIFVCHFAVAINLICGILIKNGSSTHYLAN